MDHVEIYKEKSDSRTREYLKHNHCTLVELSDVQKDRLIKLEKELANRETEGKKVSENTGIPKNIATLDVVKIAMMLGLVKSKRVREGKEPDKTFSILDLFKTHEPRYEKRKVDFTGIPFYFNHSPNRILEEEKLETISNRVKEECNRMTVSLARIVRTYRDELNTSLFFECSDDRVESFTREAITILNDLVDDLVELEATGEIEEVLILMSEVRSRLLGLIPLNTYMSIIKSHVKLMKKLGLNGDQVLIRLSPVEAFLVLVTSFDRRPIPENAHGLFILDLQMMCFTKNQQIRPFDPSELQCELCTPSIMFVHAQDVIRYGIIGPYGNNSVGYLNDTFYLLKHVTNDIRMWVVDDNLEKTTEWTQRVMTDYIVQTFRTVYVHIYGDNIYREDFLIGRRYFHVAISNLLFVNSNRFSMFMRHVMQKYSRIIPTELDMFNQQRKRRRSQTPVDNSGEHVISLLFEHVEDMVIFSAMIQKYF